MKPARRTILIWTAGLLAAGDLLFLLPAALPVKRAWVTYVGLDSAGYMVPVDQAASAFRHGRWEPKLDDTRLAPDPVDYVTLAGEPTYGHFLRIIRDLKKRHRCNVLVQYPGIRVVEPVSAGFKRALDVPALVLCGRALGDAGITEPVPNDGFVSAGEAS